MNLGVEDEAEEEMSLIFVCMGCKILSFKMHALWFISHVLFKLVSAFCFTTFS